MLPTIIGYAIVAILFGMAFAIILIALTSRDDDLPPGAA